MYGYQYAAKTLIALIFLFKTTIRRSDSVYKLCPKIYECALQYVELGRAIVQAVSRWLPTVAARIRARVRSCGIYCVQSGTGAGFLLVFSLGSNSSDRSTLIIIRGWYSRPVVDSVIVHSVPPYPKKGG
jgi:hypothetical protein